MSSSIDALRFAVIPVAARTTAAFRPPSPQGRGRSHATPPRVFRRFRTRTCYRSHMRAALVTGGSSGIGLAIARLLREEGFELTLASRTPEKVEAAAAELDAHAVAADVSREEDCARLVREHADRHGRLDVLVNSAGIGVGGTVEQLS